jgi:hypothetical protein
MHNVGLGQFLMFLLFIYVAVLSLMGNTGISLIVSINLYCSIAKLL